MIAMLLWRLAPPEVTTGDDPFSMFGGWDSGQLVWLAILVPVAVLVFSVGSRRVRAQLGGRAILPRGRTRWVPGHERRDDEWRTALARLESRPPTPIAAAQTGLVRIQGVITSSTGNLGGVPGRECVWRNRAGAGPSTAVATELLFVADESGRCGVEELEQARVVAPVDKLGAHYESTSLHVGDRVEVLGRFEREVLGEDEDPTRLVYGTLGGDGRLDVRVLERPEPEPPVMAAEAESPAASASDPDEGSAGTSFNSIPTRPDHTTPPRTDATPPDDSPGATAPAPDAPEPQP